ncbi:MAG TPA: PepSY-associated TM helix domain-containing protein [Stellaceae bacterium]
MSIAWRATVLRRLHLILGGVLSLPLAIIGLTGSVLIFEPQLQPGSVFASASVGPAQSYAAMVDAARAAAPKDFTPSAIFAPVVPGDLAQIRFSDPRRPGPGGVEVYLDPSILAVRGVVKPGEGWLREIFFLHANAGMRDRNGREIGGWLGVVMCVLAITGIVMQFPTRGRWRQAMVVQRGAQGYRLLRQLHGMIGFWFWLMLLMVSFSGVWLSFPQTFNALTANAGVRDLRPGVAAPKVTPVEGVIPVDIDGAVALAHAARPDLSLRTIGLPQRADQPYRMTLGEAHALPVIVFVDPWRRNIADLRDPHDYSLAERIVASMHALHDGSGFGWGWRVLVFISGLLPALFATSGIAMWLTKRRLDRATRHVQLTPIGAPGE